MMNAQAVLLVLIVRWVSDILLNHSSQLYIAVRSLVPAILLDVYVKDEAEVRFICMLLYRMMCTTSSDLAAGCLLASYQIELFPVELLQNSDP